MLESKRTPHSLKFVQVEILVEFHFVQLLNNQLFLKMGKGAKNPIVAIIQIAHILAIFSLIIKMRLIDESRL